jgi:hypothetical protein
LRRVDDKPVSLLPQDEVAQQQLATRCGHRDLDAFLAQYRDTRKSIADFCRWSGSATRSG